MPIRLKDRSKESLKKPILFFNLLLMRAISEEMTLTRIIVCFCLVLTSVTFVSGQCGCEDCPAQLNPGIGGGVQSLIEISGANNPTIGVNGQGLRSVRLNLIHASLEEIDVILSKQGGIFFSRLIEQNGNSNSDTVTLEVCFINCNEAANPDEGFPETFDSGAGYSNDSTYTGSYYPSQSNGCYDDAFNGVAVNGTWQLSISGSPSFGGTLVDWELDFYDNSGTSCVSFCVEPSNDCDASSGNIDPSLVSACEGSPDLDLVIPVDFLGDEPSPLEYDYYFVIADQDGVIIELQEDPNLTTFNPGTYSICGLSVLIEDFPLIPLPDGSFSLGNLGDDIDDQLYCADLSSDCWTVTVVEEDLLPQIIGPDSVCVNELAIFTLEGLPVEDWTDGEVEGPFLSLEFNLPDIEVAWGPGGDTREICYSYSNGCIEGTVCKEVVIIQPPAFTTTGPIEVCEGVTYNYEIEPAAPPGTSWEVSLTGGTLISVSEDGFTAEWFENGGSNFGVVLLSGGFCGDSPPNTISVNLLSVNVPDISVPDELCLNDQSSAFVLFDPLVDEYIWSGTGITVLSGQGTNGPLEFTVDELGFVEICLDINTSCGPVNTICEIINVTAPPEPTILPVDPQCDFEFSLTADTDVGSTGQWSAIAGPPGANIINPLNNTTLVSVSQSGVYTFQFTENSGGCEGSALIEVEILPSPNVEQGDFFCTDGNYEVEIIISGGLEPYLVDGVNITGNVFLSGPINGGDPYSFVITDANGCETTIEGLIECPCLTDAGTMSTALIEACISTGESAIAIHNNDATIGSNDIGQCILHTNSGPALGFVIEVNDTGVFNFQPPMEAGEVYYVSYVVGQEVDGAVNIEDDCLAVAVGQPVIFYDDPIVSINSPDLFCQDDDVFLEVTILSGVTGISWTQISGPAPAVISNPTSVFTEVDIDAPGAYGFEVVVSNEACTVTESIDIDVLESGEIVDVETDCQGASAYILTFQIEDDIDVDDIDLPGSLLDGVFTSELLDADIVYDITVTFSNGCSTEFSVGPIDCECENDSGTMGSEELSACISDGGTVQATFNNDATLQSGDVGFYYLHDAPGQFLGQVFDFNGTGEFGFQPDMVAGVTYYISYVIGQESGDGIDLDDSCLKVAEGQPVVFYDDPTVVLDISSEICGLSNTLIADELGDDETIIWQSVVGPDDVNISNPNADSTSVTVSAFGSYELSYTVSNQACSISDSFIIAFNELPVAGDLDVVCEDVDFFTVQFEIIGGQAPFSVNGEELSGTTFLSDPIPSGDTLVLSITDANGCTSDSIEVTTDCECANNVGPVNPSSFALCIPDNIEIASIDIENLEVEEDYVVFYVLHNGTPAAIGDILDVSNGEPLRWRVDYAAGEAYFLTVVISTLEDGGINFEDPCITFSAGIPVIWSDGPTVSIEGSSSICAGDEAQLNIVSTGEYPYDIRLISDGGDVLEVVLEGESQNVVFPGTETNTVWSVDQIESDCPAEVSGSFEIVVTDIQTITLLTPNEICNNSEFGSVLNLNTLLVDQDLEGEWFFNGAQTSSDIIDFDGLEEGVYQITFSTVGFASPCPGETASVDIIVEDCQCPQLNFPDSIGFCSTEGIILLDENLELTVEGEWRINELSGNGELPSISDDQIDVSAADGVYELVYELDSIFPDECPSTFAVILSVESPANAGVSSSGNIVCPIGEDIIVLDALLSGADGGGLWIDESGAEIMNTIPVNALTPGANLFTYRIAGVLCPLSESTVELILRDSIAFTTEVSQAFCPDETSGVLIEFLNVEGEAEVLINGVAQDNGPFFTLEPGTNTIQIRDSLGCISEVRSVEIELPEPLTLDLGGDLTVDFGRQVTLSFVTNLTEEEIVSINWLNSGEVIATQNNTIEITVEDNKTIEVILISNEGCVVSDEINLRVVGEVPVYIPNAFHPNSELAANRRFGPLSADAIISVESFEVFDRWGNKVWSVRDVEQLTEEDFWDGTFKGRDAEIGVYIYQLAYTNRQNESIIAAGEVMLLR